MDVASSSNCKGGPLRIYHFCPHGMQLVCSQEVPLYQVLDFSLSLKGKDGKIEKFDLQGIVIKVSPEEGQTGRSHVWVHWLNASVETRERLRLAAVDHEKLCGFCNGETPYTQCGLSTADLESLSATAPK